MNKQQIKLGLKIRKLIDDTDMEDIILDHEIDGHIYNLKEEKSGDWDDEGKYQNREYVSEVLEDGKPTGIMLSQWCSRSGSYFTDYNYEYETPELVEKTERMIKIVEYKALKK